MSHQEQAPTSSREDTNEVSSFRKFIKSKTGKVVVGAAGLSAVAGIGIGVASNHDPSNSPVPSVSESFTPSPDTTTPETVTPSPSEVIESDDFGPAGAEQKQFEASLEIPTTSTTSEVGNKYVDIISTISNIGVDKGAPEIFNKDISLILGDFSKDFVNDWKDEFSTAFDGSPESEKILNGLSIGASNYLQWYLETVDNGKAKAVFHENLTFVSASEEEPVNCDRQLLITYHAESNIADTGLSDLPNVDTDATVRVQFNEIDGILKISNVEVA